MPLSGDKKRNWSSEKLHQLHIDIQFFPFFGVAEFALKKKPEHKESINLECYYVTINGKLIAQLFG